MPRQIVTKASLPKIMRVLDHREGKLTWPLFCTQVATVFAGWPRLPSCGAIKRINNLEAQVRRLEDTNTLLLQRFQRRQYNCLRP